MVESWLALLVCGSLPPPRGHCSFIMGHRGHGAGSPYLVPEHLCSMGSYPGLHHGSGLLSQGRGCVLQVSSLEAPCLLGHPAPPVLSSPAPAPPGARAPPGNPNAALQPSLCWRPPGSAWKRKGPRQEVRNFQYGCLGEGP